MPRLAYGVCDGCSEADYLRRAPVAVLPDGRVPMLCPLCREGRALGITGRVELNAWSLRRRRERDVMGGSDAI